MWILSFYSSDRILLAALLGLLLSAAPALPAPAQEVLVQNGATVEVSNGGVLDLQGGQMDFGPAGATATLKETSAGRVTGGTLTATRALSSPSQADPAGLGAVISASVDLGEVTVTRGHTVQTASNSNESIRRYYDISPSQNNSGLSATLTHRYADAELNGLSESELKLFKSIDGGSTWSEEGFDGRDATANTVRLSDISSFSRWTLGSEANPLPVELARLEARQTKTGGDREAVQLTWTTASETNNAGFEVQRRKAETGAWQQVGFRESAASGGNTSEPQTYRFTDENLPYAADTLAYRLRQVDVGGSWTLSDQVIVGRSGPGQLQLLGTAPNPARTRATVRYGVPEGTDGTVRMRLFDTLGRQVRSVAVDAKAGRHKETLNVGGLASGVYVLRLSGSGQAVTQKMSVVR